jgi:hypothetical protein
MFGKKLPEYFRFESWILVLIVVVFLARLGLSLSGTPFSVNRWVSINIVLLVGLLYCSVAVHTRRFGSYSQLFGLLLMQGFLAHILIALGIVLGIVTGTDNAYTVPEVFGGANGRNVGHAAAHLIASVLFAGVAWLIGSAILFVTKKVARQDQ